MGLLRQPDPWDTGGMYRVEIYGRVRRAVLVEGRSQRAVAREFGISRDMVRKMLRYAAPAGVSAAASGEAAQAGAVAGRDRRHPGRRQEATGQAAAPAKPTSRWTLA